MCPYTFFTLSLFKQYQSVVVIIIIIIIYVIVAIVRCCDELLLSHPLSLVISLPSRKNGLLRDHSFRHNAVRTVFFILLLLAALIAPSYWENDDELETIQILASHSLLLTFECLLCVWLFHSVSFFCFDNLF